MKKQIQERKRQEELAKKEGTKKKSALAIALMEARKAKEAQDKAISPGRSQSGTGT